MLQNIDCRGNGLNYNFKKKKKTGESLLETIFATNSLDSLQYFHTL